MYKHYIPQISLSIEKNTGTVPSDGKYHIVKDGKVIQSYRSKKMAEEKFKQIVEEIGYKHPKPANESTNQTSESLDRFLSDRIVFHSEGAKYRGRGGRGR